MAPSIPQNVTAMPVSDGQINLTWTDPDPTGSVGSFTVARSSDGGATWQTVGTVDGSIFTLADIGVLPSSAYAFNVTASNAAGTSAASPTTAPSSATTFSGVPIISAAVSTNDTGSIVAVVWSCDGNNVEGFELESHLDGPDAQGIIHNFSLIEVAGPGTGTYMPPGLLPGHQYEFRVRADFADGTVSDYAGTSVDVPPVPPPPGPSETLTPPTITGLTANDPSGYDYNLTFDSDYPINDSTLGQTDYVPNAQIVRTNDPYEVLHGYGDDTFLFLNNPNVPPHYSAFVHFEQVTPGAEYQLLLSVFDPITGEGSAYSNPVTFTAPGVLPSALNLTASPVDANGNVTISWTLPDGQTLGGVSLYRVTSTGCAWVGNANLLDGEATIPAGTGASSIFAVWGEPGISSPYSNFVNINNTATTPPANPGFVSAIYDPSVPGGQVKLFWANSSDNETSFDIYRVDDNNLILKVGSTAADQTTFVDHPANKYDPGDNGPWTYYVQAVNSAGFTKPVFPAHVSAIGGPDISIHLLKIRSAIMQTWAKSSPTKRAALTNAFYTSISNQASNWEITELAKDNVTSPHNSGVLPDGTHTVTVDRFVYEDAVVNYWIYGVWASLVGASPAWCKTKITGWRLGQPFITGTGPGDISGRMDWFNAGYSGAFKDAIDAAIDNVVPAKAPPTGESSPPLHFHIGLGPPGNIMGEE